MRKIFSVSIILVSLIFSSCVTDNMIPGRKGAQVLNLYKEYMNLGDAYYDLKKYDKAIECYKQASGFKEFYWNCVYKMADSYFRLGNWSESESLYLKLIKRDGDNLQLKEALAYVYASQGKFSESLEIYSKLQEDFPENQSFLENQIVLLITSGENKLAREKVENLKTLFPDNTKVETYSKKLDEIAAAENPVQNNQENGLSPETGSENDIKKASEASASEALSEN